MDENVLDGMVRWPKSQPFQVMGKNFLPMVLGGSSQLVSGW